MKTKIEIKNRWTGEILFEYKKENNTIKDTLIEAVKQNADLRGADLRNAYLGGANLRSANIDSATLIDAKLSGANGIPFIPLACPSDGAFIGWKKVGGCIIKLEIPEDAKRCSATGTKCRCDKAKVLEISYISTGEKINEITNGHECIAKVTYKVGEMVFPDSFDEDRWNECSHGIHFFINKQEAIDY